MAQRRRRLVCSGHQGAGAIAAQGGVVVVGLQDPEADRIPRRVGGHPMGVRLRLGAHQPRPARNLQGEPLVGVVEIDVEPAANLLDPVGHRIGVQVQTAP